MTFNDIEIFCQEHDFLFHKHGSGTFGADRYWTFYKVENNDTTVFSIEYFPMRETIKIKKGGSRYQGLVESVAHLRELLDVMRIKEHELTNGR
jgi:hypothetical protein